MVKIYLLSEGGYFPKKVIDMLKNDLKGKHNLVSIVAKWEYDGIIFGLSAGTMNLGKIAFYSKDEDYPKSLFYNGLGLTNLTIDPHFDINNKDRVEEAIKFSKEHKIIELPDYSAIIFDKDDNVINIGPKYIYEDGKVIK